MNRRQFIELAGAIATLDAGLAGADAGRDSSPLVDPGDGAYRTVLDRFPSPPVPGSQPPHLTVSVGSPGRYAVEPAVLGDVDLQGGLFAGGAMMAVGAGGPDPPEVPDRVPAFESRGELAGHELYGRWDGRRFRGVVADGVAVYVGVGSAAGPVRRWLEAAVGGARGPAAGRPSVERAVDLLGPVTVASLEPQVEPDPELRETSRRPRPTVLARGIALGKETATVREVRSYDSRAGARRADGDDWSWASDVGALSAPTSRQDGRAVVAEAVADPAPLVEGSILDP